MFAILISQENMPKIEKFKERFAGEVDFQTSMYLNSNSLWYFVTGYYDRRGRTLDWTILPAYVLEEDFEFDAEKIRTEWDQIVRK